MYIYKHIHTQRSKASVVAIVAVALLVDSFYIAKHYLCCQCFIKGPVAVHNCIVGHCSVLVAIVSIYRWISYTYLHIYVYIPVFLFGCAAGWFSSVYFCCRVSSTFSAFF